MLKLYRCDASPLELMPLKRFGRIHAVHLESVRRIALPVRPDRLVAKPRIRIEIRKQFRIHARRKNSNCVKLPVASGVSSICVASSV